MDIRTLGPDGSYCSQVAKAVGGEDPKITYTGSNLETIRRLKGCDFGILPIQNKYGGVVAGNMREILEVSKNRTVKVLGCYSLPIRHVLACREGVTERDITSVHSHPQALLQCTINLEKLHARRVATDATTAKISTLGMDEAVICSLEAANNAGLTILDNYFCPEDNVTDFLALTSRKNLPSESHPQSMTEDKTISIIKGNPHIYPKIQGILGESDIPVFFSEPVPNGKGGLYFPTVTGTFGSGKTAVARKIRKLGGEITFL